MPRTDLRRAPLRIAPLACLALTLLLAACASTQEEPKPNVPDKVEGASTTETPQPDSAKATPSLTMSPSLAVRPKAPPRNGADYAQREDARALSQTLAQTLDMPGDWVWNQLSQARYRETVTRLIMPAASSTAKNWTAYRSRFVEPVRIRAGQAFWKAQAAELKRAEQQFGVAAWVIAGVLGVETIYGRQTGNFRVLDVLATLSLDFPSGRSDRSAFFRKELGEFLKLCQEQGLAPQTVQGSYAGAIGWPQFMPSSIRRYAIDFDGDGRIDLQRSPVDAIGSVANYLAAHGWRTGEPGYYEVTPPTDTNALGKLLAPDIVPTFTAEEMQALGAVLPPEAREHAGKLALVQLLNGSDAPTLVLGTQNFYAVTRYNQSSYYALAVIQLGQTVSSP